MDHKQILAGMRTAFQSEAIDLLDELDSSLLQLEAEPSNPELINRVFRAIHTIKGSGATAGFERLAHFAHRVEEVFNAARDGKVSVTPELMDFALKACDLLRVLLSDADQTAGLQAETERNIVNSLAQFISKPEPLPAVAVEPLRETSNGLSRYHIRFKPTSAIFLSGTDPTSLLQELSSLGTAYVTPRLECVPRIEELEPERCYVWWEIDLETTSTVDVIRDIFIFVSDDCELQFATPDGAGSASSRVGGRQFDLFYCEAEEHLDAAEQHLLRIEKSSSPEDWASLFRHLHSLKGACALLQGEAGELNARHPLRLLHSIAHASESLVESERAAGFAHAAEIGDTLLQVIAALRTLLFALDKGGEAEVDAALLEHLGITVDPQRAVSNGLHNAKETALQETAKQCLEAMHAMLAQPMGAADPATQKTYLRALQTLSGACTYAGLHEIQALLRDHANAYRKSATQGPGRSDVEQLSRDLDRVRALLFTRAQDGASPGPAPSSSTSQAFRMRSTDSSSQTIRVDQEKLDRLFRNVSELLVARGTLPLLARRLDRDLRLTEMSRDVKDSGNTISRIAEELQNTVMSLRMIPIRSVFQRFPRLARDLARSLGKEIEVIMEGEDTELDKTVIQDIGDPLVHLVRNAADHGIELPGERMKSGKPPCGRITLRAYNEASYAVIEIEDDGKGLHADVLKAKAVEKGIISSEEAAVMNDDASFGLIFKPGFSTAAKVSDVSGRGVGMDVVCSNVEKLKGTVSIKSEAGRGTKFIVKLPTSLMISKGVLVECAGEEFMLPVESIADMRKVSGEELRLCGRQRMVHTPKGMLPVVSLSETLELSADHNRKQEKCLAVMQGDRQFFGLLVDRFVSEEQVVVKPLTGGLEKRDEFLGATIMGDGRVVLVLNPKQIAF